jgi:hypothetical protein
MACYLLNILVRMVEDDCHEDVIYPESLDFQSIFKVFTGIEI